MTTFRIAEDGSLCDVMDDERNWPKHPLRLAHPTTLSKQLCGQWTTLFNEYDIGWFVPQLAAGPLRKYDKGALQLPHYQGVKVDALRLRKSLEKYGFTEDPVGSHISTMYKETPGSDCTVAVHVVGLGRVHEHVDVTIERVEFTVDSRVLPLSQVPTAMLAETACILEAIVS